jgi:hypothetical protein
LTTHLEIDPEVLQLVRRADPLLVPRAAETDLDADAALTALSPRLTEPSPWLNAPEPLLTARSRRRPRRLKRVPRAVLVACGAAGAAFLAVNLINTGSGRLAVSPARAAMIVKAARAALLYPPGTVLEQEAVSRDGKADGSTVTSDFHFWVSATPPYENSRMIVNIAGRPSFEQEIVKGKLNLYDPSDNTIYEQAPPTYDLSPGTSPGTFVLTVPKATIEDFCSRPVPPADSGTTTLIITAAQAEALRTGAATVEYTGHQGDVQTDPRVMPHTPVVPDDPNITSALAEVRYMLTQPGVIVDPHATLNGARAIRISSADGRFVYWVSPGDYRPLQVADNMNGSASTTEYPVYRVLTGQAASQSIFSLTAQHPSAKINTNGDDYASEKCRLGLGNF